VGEHALADEDDAARRGRADLVGRRRGGAEPDAPEPDAPEPDAPAVTRKISVSPTGTSVVQPACARHAEGDCIDGSVHAVAVPWHEAVAAL
jgi:hypothetical protein